MPDEVIVADLRQIDQCKSAAGRKTGFHFCRSSSTAGVLARYRRFRFAS
jgi:hypothetical protein